MDWQYIMSGFAWGFLALSVLFVLLSLVLELASCSIFRDIWEHFSVWRFGGAVRRGDVMYLKNKLEKSDWTVRVDVRNCIRKQKISDERKAALLKALAL